MTSRTTGGGGNSSYITPNANKYSLAGWTVDSPSDVIYNGKEQKWVPNAIVDNEGTIITEDYKYATPVITYSTDDFTNVTGSITVTIKLVPKLDNVTFEDQDNPPDDYPSEFTRTYQINPATITVKCDNIKKNQGEADPKLTSVVSGMIGDECPGWTGSLVREPGEAPGTYPITQGYLQLADGTNGFLASNYTLYVIPGTFTIWASVPVTPGGGTTPAG